MSTTSAAIQQLAQAIVDKQPSVHIDKTTASLEHLFQGALKRDRRLLAYLKSYKASYLKESSLSLAKEYNIIIQFQDILPDKVDDVVLADPGWDSETALLKTTGRRFLVTNNRANVERIMDELLIFAQEKEEGLFGWQYETSDFPSISQDILFHIENSYIMDSQQLSLLQHKAVFTAKNIWHKILGRATVPLFVKPFLAFSYLQQECRYDQAAYDSVVADQSSLPADPIPHLAYGPLVESRGICDGLAWAFQVLMEEAGIKSQCVVGRYIGRPVRHMWNLIQLDGVYYHMDPSWGIQNGGVHIEGMFLSDSLLKATHEWDMTHTPAAKGYRYDYNYIEQFLVENGAEYLDNGASERYMFPDELVE